MSDEETSEEILNKFEYLLNDGQNDNWPKANSKWVDSFRKSTGIDKDLKIDYCWFFMFIACWYKNQKDGNRGGIGYAIHQDNLSIARYYKEKSYAHRTYQIIKNKRYVFRLSVEVDGSFNCLHENGFLRSLILLIPNRFNDGDKVNVIFDDFKDSVHFVYESDEHCIREEKIILSVQAYDLTYEERMSSFCNNVIRLYNRLRFGIGIRIR